jgi:hypothetical protein
MVIVVQCKAYVCVNHNQAWEVSYLVIVMTKEFYISALYWFNYLDVHNRL